MEKKDEKKKERCAFISCNKKVGLLGLVCKCKKKFCSIHFYKEKHNCEFDYKKEDSESVLLIDARFKKIDKI